MLSLQVDVLGPGVAHMVSYIYSVISLDAPVPKPLLECQLYTLITYNPYIIDKLLIVLL